MSDFTKQLEAALAKESMQDRLLASMMTLAEEYEAKTITPDRFSERIHTMLLGYARAVRMKRSEPQSDEGKP